MKSVPSLCIQFHVVVCRFHFPLNGLIPSVIVNSLSHRVMHDHFLIVWSPDNAHLFSGTWVGKVYTNDLRYTLIVGKRRTIVIKSRPFGVDPILGPICVATLSGNNCYVIDAVLCTYI